MSELKELHIDSDGESNASSIDPLCWLIEHRLTRIALDVKFPYSTKYHFHSPTDVYVGSVLKTVLRSNKINKMDLSNISRETMAGVRSILLHCLSLTTLELKRTRLGYDGILYICSALRNNTTLSHLVIHDGLQLPPRSESRWKYNYVSFSSMERVSLPGKTTCTDFLLELNNILKDNTTLEVMKIQSGLFLPLSAGEDRDYCQWTGLGPLQQFNVGAVGSGMSPNLRRSFSLSDLTPPQTTLFWDRRFIFYMEEEIIHFKELFSKRKVEGIKLFPLPSFTAPDAEVLQSFSGLDPRLKECLEISHLHQYVKKLRDTALFIESSSFSVDTLSTALSPNSKKSTTFGSSMPAFEPEESVVYVGKACSYTSQTGIILHFPAAECQTPIKVSVKIVNGDYTLPPEYGGMPLVSSMFKITASDDLPVPITVQIEHCAVVDKEDCLLHMIAHDPLPYQFKPLPGGKFPIMGSYGEIQLKQFSILTTIFCRMFTTVCKKFGLYMILSFFVFYHRDNTATFVATKYLNEAIEAVKEWFDDAIECFEQPMIYYCYPTRDIALTIPEAKQGKWSIVPKCEPPTIQKELICNYQKGKQPPSIQLEMKWTGEGPPKEEKIKIKLKGCSVESFTLTCMSPDKRVSQSQKQSKSTTNWVTQKAGSRALQRSNEIFIKGACPESLLAALYSRGLLTSNEKKKAMKQSLTGREKLQEIFEALKRRVFINPEHFITLLQILQNESATKEVAESMKAIYEEECRKKQ